MRQTESSYGSRLKKAVIYLPQLNGKLCLPLFFCTVFFLEAKMYSSSVDSIRLFIVSCV